MALHISAVDPVNNTRERIAELVGTPHPRRGGTPSRVALSVQPALVEGFVELVRLRTELAERDCRILSLTEGLRAWRERAGTEQAQRRAEAAEASDREREIISLLHQQMQVADSATAELERLHALPWWRRLRA